MFSFSGKFYYFDQKKEHLVSKHNDYYDYYYLLF